MHCSTGPFVDVVSISDHAVFAEQLAPCAEYAVAAQVAGRDSQMTVCTFHSSQPTVTPHL